MKPSGAHTHPEMSGGGNGWIIILILILVAAIAEPVAHAITDLLKAIAIAIAGLTAITLIVGSAVVIYRVRRSSRSLPRSKVRALPAPIPREPQGGVRALEGAQEVHLHFHGVTAEQVAAILARQEEVR